jgi:hypothetical protein
METYSIFLKMLSVLYVYKYVCTHITGVFASIQIRNSQPIPKFDVSKLLFNCRYMDFVART